MIIIVFGLPGSGKSYFANPLAEMMNAEYINSDQVRKEVICQKSYSEEEKLSVYEEMLARMTKAATRNKNVVLDATFYKHDIRKKFIEGINQNEKVLFIQVIADESLIRQRLQTTRTDSEADFEVYKKVKQQWEPFDEPHLVLHSTNNNINRMLHKAAQYLNVNNDIRTNK
jgi:predicted kinase